MAHTYMDMFPWKFGKQILMYMIDLCIPQMIKENSFKTRWGRVRIWHLYWVTEVQKCSKMTTWRNSSIFERKLLSSTHRKLGVKDWFSGYVHDINSVDQRSRKLFPLYHGYQRSLARYYMTKTSAHSKRRQMLCLWFRFGAGWDISTGDFWSLVWQMTSHKSSSVKICV